MAKISYVSSILSRNAQSPRGGIGWYSDDCKKPTRTDFKAKWKDFMLTFHDSRGAPGGKLKMTLGLPVYVPLAPKAEDDSTRGWT